MNHTATMTAAALAAALALAGCNKRDDMPVPRTGDNPSATTSQSTAGDSTAANTSGTGTTARDAANDVKDATRSAADQATNKVADAMITTSVKTELAKDPTLSALRINVDTDSGRVALRGTAPDVDAKDRATKLASNVKGVVSVDNQLVISKS